MWMPRKTAHYTVGPVCDNTILNTYQLYNLLSITLVKWTYWHIS